MARKKKESSPPVAIIRAGTKNVRVLLADGSEGDLSVRDPCLPTLPKIDAETLKARRATYVRDKVKEVMSLYPQIRDL